MFSDLALRELAPQKVVFIDERLLFGWSHTRWLRDAFDGEVGPSCAHRQEEQDGGKTETHDKDWLDLFSSQVRRGNLESMEHGDDILV